jgi:hypothetical protein
VGTWTGVPFFCAALTSESFIAESVAPKSTVFAVVVNCPPGPVGLAVTAFPRRGELDAATGPSELPGTDGLYEIDHQVVSLLDPAVLLTAERIGRREFGNDATHIEVG